MPEAAYDKAVDHKIELHNYREREEEACMSHTAQEDTEQEEVVGNQNLGQAEEVSFAFVGDSVNYRPAVVAGQAVQEVG